MWLRNIFDSKKIKFLKSLKSDHNSKLLLGNTLYDVYIGYNNTINKQISLIFNDERFTFDYDKIKYADEKLFVVE